jgi:hypothetical protein
MKTLTLIIEIISALGSIPFLIILPYLMVRRAYLLMPETFKIYQVLAFTFVSAIFFNSNSGDVLKIVYCLYAIVTLNNFMKIKSVLKFVYYNIMLAVCPSEYYQLLVSDMKYYFKVPIDFNFIIGHEFLVLTDPFLRNTKRKLHLGFCEGNPEGFVQIAKFYLEFIKDADYLETLERYYDIVAFNTLSLVLIYLIK